MRTRLQIGNGCSPPGRRLAIARNGMPRRPCACGGHTHDGACQTSTTTGRALWQGLESPSRSLEPDTRSWMESHFQHDFSGVRLHTGPAAAGSARALKAHAYAIGQNVVFSPGAYRPEDAAGRWVLAHELAHVVQQRGRAPNASQDVESKSHPVFESQANAAADAVWAGGLAPRPSVFSDIALMRLTPDEFRDQLGSTPDQKSAIKVLFADKAFLDLWNYLGTCAATPAKDLGPLALRVTPGLTSGGVQRFGGYSPASHTLEINPTKPEHKDNPSELVDTIAHELIHAVDDLAFDCKAAGSGQAPLHGAATKISKPLADVKGTAEENRLLADVGPGASNPCEEFIDINKTAQQIVIEIIARNIKKAKVGRPTIIYLNEILRRFPKAITDYKKCRDIACAEPDADKRKAAIGVCSNSVLTKYLPIATDLKPKDVKP